MKRIVILVGISVILFFVMTTVVITTQAREVQCRQIRRFTSQCWADHTTFIFSR